MLMHFCWGGIRCLDDESCRNLGNFPVLCCDRFSNDALELDSCRIHCVCLGPSIGPQRWHSEAWSNQALNDDVAHHSPCTMHTMVRC